MKIMKKLLSKIYNNNQKIIINYKDIIDAQFV